ncbi:hypothetical protein D3C76_1710260 [compost metagenome]
MVSPVNLGRFLQTLLYSLERSAHNNQVEGTDSKRNDGGPQGIDKARTLDHQVQRNQTAMEEHRKYDQNCKHVVPHYTSAG